MMPSSDVNNTNGALPAAENAERALQPRTQPLHPVVVSHTPPALSAAPNAVSLLKALQRHLGMALTVGLILAAVVGTAVWLLLPPPKKAARMLLHVAPIQPRILFEDPTQAALQNEAFIRNQAFLVRDRLVLNAALNEPGIANLSLIREQEEDPVQWLERTLVVDFPSPEFMRIILSGDRPEDQIRIVNAVTKAYMENIVNVEKNERRERQERLGKTIVELESKFSRKKEELRQKQMDAGGFNEESLILSQQIAEEELLAVKKQLTEVRHQLLLLSVEMGLHPNWQEKVWPQYAAGLLSLQLGHGLPVNHALVGLLHDEYLVALSAPNATALNERDLDEISNKDEEITHNLQRIKEQRSLLAKMEVVLQPTEYKKQSKKVLDDVANLEQEIEKRRKTLQPRLALMLRNRLHTAAKNERITREAKYRDLKALESELEKAAKKLSEQCKKKLQDGLDMVRTMEEFEAAKKLVQHANDNLMRLEVEQQAPSRITQPSKEAVLFTPEATKRKLMITAGSALGALALVLLAFAWFEFQSRKVYTPDEVVQGLGLHLVGTVPDHSPRGWLPWSRNNDENEAYTQSMLTESVDTARTQLLHVARKEKLQIVMITSALAGEGKTSLASHLAASLARAGRRTILVDSDLRNPSLHRLFKFDRVPGLSEFLRGEVDLAGVTRETVIPNLSMISAGKADSTALQALAFEVISKLFEQLRLHYDFIIVDSCPVLPVADSMLVGQHVDAVIFSLLREVSRLPRVHAAYQRLAALGIRMLGAVVNGTQHDRYPADYHYLVQDEEG